MHDFFPQAKVMQARAVVKVTELDCAQVSDGATESTFFCMEVF